MPPIAPWAGVFRSHVPHVVGSTAAAGQRGSGARTGGTVERYRERYQEYRRGIRREQSTEQSRQDERWGENVRHGQLKGWELSRFYGADLVEVGAGKVGMQVCQWWGGRRRADWPRRAPFRGRRLEDTDGGSESDRSLFLLLLLVAPSSKAGRSCMPSRSCYLSAPAP